MHYIHDNPGEQITKTHSLTPYHGGYYTMSLIKFYPRDIS